MRQSFVAVPCYDVAVDERYRNAWYNIPVGVLIAGRYCHTGTITNKYRINVEHTPNPGGNIDGYPGARVSGTQVPAHVGYPGAWV